MSHWEKPEILIPEDPQCHVGGLAHVKSDVLDTIQLPLDDTCLQKA